MHVILISDVVCSCAIAWVAALVRSALEMSLNLGRAAAGVRGPLRAWRRKALQRIFEAGDSLRLQFPLEDLGFCYSAPGAAVCLVPLRAASSAKTAVDSAVQNLRAQKGRGVEYVQNTEPGSRLPHCNIRLLASEQHSSGKDSAARLPQDRSQAEAGQLHTEDPQDASAAGKGAEISQSDQQQADWSTHDLLDAGSTSLLLLLGQGSAAAVWAAAAHSINEEFDFHTFRIVQLLDGQRSAQRLHQAVLVAEDVRGKWQSLRQVCSAICVQIHAVCCLKEMELRKSGAFGRLCLHGVLAALCLRVNHVSQVTDDGAILVRPDGHIAWRSDSLERAGHQEGDRISAAATELRMALRSVHYRSCKTGAL